MKRYGSVIKVKPEKLDEYKRLHADVWPEVLKMIRECNISNYSIYLGDLEKDKYYLFSCFEYVGEDFEADMAKMAADSEISLIGLVMAPLPNVSARPATVGL